MDKNTKTTLKALIQTREDLLEMRKATDNRLEIKANGERQNKDNALIDWSTIPEMLDVRDGLVAQIKAIEKRIAKIVYKEPIWDDFLKGVKGCGPVMAAVLLSQIDIEVGIYRSKLFQFAGLNAGLVRGRKKDDNGNVYHTDEMVRGDKKTAGFLIPYNEWLRAKLIGVLVPGMIKAKDPKYYPLYVGYKERLRNETNEIYGRADHKRWCDTSNLHRDNAAKRYIAREFLGDLYEHWRRLEGLPVRCRYEEEYLGIVHNNPAYITSGVR